MSSVQNTIDIKVSHETSEAETISILEKMISLKAPRIETDGAAGYLTREISQMLSSLPKDKRISYTKRLIQTGYEEYILPKFLTFD